MLDSIMIEKLFKEFQSILFVLNYFQTFLAESASIECNIWLYISPLCGTSTDQSDEKNDGKNVSCLRLMPKLIC